MSIHKCISLRRPIEYRQINRKRGGVWLRAGADYCALMFVLSRLGRHVSLVYVA